MAKTGCVIFAKDIERLAAFYKDVLKLKVDEKEKGHQVLSNRTVELVIHGIPKSVAKNIEIETPPVKRGNTPIKPVFIVKSLDDLVAPIKEHGGGLKPVKSAWELRGSLALDGWDPEGNVINFKQNVK